jgi:Zn-dependent protease
MRGGIRIGTIWNVPVFMDVGAFFLLGLFTWLTSSFYSLISPQWSLIFGLGTGVALSLSILWHELAHTWVARSQQITVKQVTLSLSGGFTEMDQEYPNPWTAFAVAVIGPLASLMLGLGALLIATHTGALTILAGFTGVSLRDNPQLLKNLVSERGAVTILTSLACLEIGRLNIIWGCFNLLPFFPLDGGQVLRSIFWKITGDRLKSIVWSAQIGQVCGTGLVILGIIFVFQGGGWDSLWLMLIGWLISNTAGGKVQISQLQEGLLQVTSETAMTRDFRLVDAHMSLREFVDRYLLLNDKTPIFVATSQGRDKGLVKVEKIKQIAPDAWTQTEVMSVVQPLNQVETVELNQPLAWVIYLLETKQLPFIPVLSPVGSIAGVIDRGDIVTALARKMRWHIPEAFIQQIKADGKFPDNFPLVELSQQLINHTQPKDNA